MEKVILSEKFRKITEHWSPVIVGELNGQMVKIAKFKGEFPMHHHENEDELFMVIEEKCFIELDNRTIELNKNELFIVPKGTKHRPFAPEEAQVLMFEPASTLNTGNEVNEFTKRDLERI